MLTLDCGGETETGWDRVIPALPTAVGLAKLVAVTVTSTSLPEKLVGAVYTPLLIVPSWGLMDQETCWFVVPLTIADNETDVPAETRLEAGEILTLIGGAGTLGGAEGTVGNVGAGAGPGTTFTGAK